MRWGPCFHRDPHPQVLIPPFVPLLQGNPVPCIPECTLRGEDPSPGQPPSRHWGSLGPSPPPTAAAPTVAASFPRGHLGGPVGSSASGQVQPLCRRAPGWAANKRLHSCTGNRGEHTVSYSTLRLAGAVVPKVPGVNPKHRPEWGHTRCPVSCYLHSTPCLSTHIP